VNVSGHVTKNHSARSRFSLIGLLATGMSSKISAEVTAFATDGSDLIPRHKRPVANVSVSQGGLHYPYERSASFSVHDISELNGLGPK
jgi:hypothetical protein